MKVHEGSPRVSLAIRLYIFQIQLSYLIFAEKEETYVKLYTILKGLGNEGFRNAETDCTKMSQTEVSNMKQKQQPIPLGTLIGRELRNEKVEKPTVKYGQAALAKKGEDYFLIKLDCQRVPGNTSSSFSVFAIFDGHNGISAAIFAKENLLNNVLSAIPQALDREEWLQALPRALVAGFVKTDIEFQQRGM
ncbi:hypothetical protein BUALT_Bualt15G0119100 [Buddleja alternifolia]|uniref:PPM-type phosphatase domain-containing protein n=1 Tax=Buddleja alternifolia TaxID=168488 RepID=A0AAV6WGE1_9LAMI|nr:hypothetical protein BUALT_Bualt15G0119100 [Buddleja alternifolia]